MVMGFSQLRTAGVFSVVSMAAGVGLAYIKISPLAGNIALICVLVLLIIAIWLFLSGRTLQKLSLKTEISSKIDLVDSLHIQVGDQALTSSRLAPMGKVTLQTGEEVEEVKAPPASAAAEKNIEKLRTDDRSKVTLSASVRERVAQGIQYVYSNTSSPEMVQATDTIASDLLSAINENDAIAIDISTLKTSDEYTFKHSVDVATIAMIVAKQQGLSQAQIHEIGVTGLLHDVGKTYTYA